jgi:hypothetical protein
MVIAEIQKHLWKAPTKSKYPIQNQEVIFIFPLRMLMLDYLRPILVLDVFRHRRWWKWKIQLGEELA